jgi:hypothetical protein
VWLRCAVAVGNAAAEGGQIKGPDRGTAPQLLHLGLAVHADTGFAVIRQERDPGRYKEDLAVTDGSGRLHASGVFLLTLFPFL